jgi:hypothetical protein
MKTALRLTSLLIGLTTSVSAQLFQASERFNLIPEHYAERAAAYPSFKGLQLAQKSSNYDRPVVIEGYQVDAMNNENFYRRYEMTYLPGGQLRTFTAYNASLVPMTRVIYNYDAMGNTSSEIFMVWDSWGGYFEFDYRRIYEYNWDGTLASLRYEDIWGGSWSVNSAYLFEYTKINNKITELISYYGNDGINYNEDLRVNFSYNQSNSQKPDVIEVKAWDTNILSFVGYEKRTVLDWGNYEFKADFLFNANHFPDNGVTNWVADNFDYVEVHFPHSNFIYEANFDVFTGQYTDKFLITSNHTASHQREELVITRWNVSTGDYLPHSKLNLLYHPCLGYRGFVEMEYVVPTGYQIDYGRSVTPTTAPFNESCYLTELDIYENFSPSTPAGTRMYNLKIEQIASLSLNENTTDNFVLYPNPVKDELHISMTEAVNSILIIGMDGRIYDEIKVTAMQLKVDVSALPAGVYSVQFVNDEAVSSAKLVKNKTSLLIAKRSPGFRGTFFCADFLLIKYLEFEF